jgi:hypothetical protein
MSGMPIKAKRPLLGGVGPRELLLEMLELQMYRPFNKY